MAKGTHSRRVEGERVEGERVVTPATRALFNNRMPSFTGITVSGFKSIREQIKIELCPLTILAGANSSGKSSIMQPLLLLKQTMEATYDPGPLKLDGPNVKFTDARQFLSASPVDKVSESFVVGFSLSDDSSATFQFGTGPDGGIEIKSACYRHKGYRKPIELRLDMSPEELAQTYPPEEEGPVERATAGKWRVIRERFILRVRKSERSSETIAWLPGRASADLVMDAIHLPGFRGNRERAYPIAAPGPPFPGTFDNYVASVIHQWQEAGDTARLDALCDGLRSLGLTGHVEAVKVTGQLEIRVGRAANGQGQSSHDLVNISDAGFGVSQALPVLVALLAAHKGSLVYLEEPEIHLHPRAQSNMARLLAQAAERGVIVVAETHSSLLLQGIQTLVAQGKLQESLVKLHWFQRGRDGFTRVRSANLDRQGRFGKWPLDFYDVILDSEASYLDAVSAGNK